VGKIKILAYRAQDTHTRPGKKLGRRPVKPAVETRIRQLRGRGVGILKIGRTLGVGTSVVQRVVNQDVR
jgi:transposase-like protein